MQKWKTIYKLVEFLLKVLLFGYQAILFLFGYFDILRIGMLLLLLVEIKVLCQELIVGIIVNFANHQYLMDVWAATKSLNFLPLFFDHFYFYLKEEIGHNTLF